MGKPLLFDERLDHDDVQDEPNSLEFDRAYKEYLIKKINDGFQDIKEGRVFSHEEALRKVLEDEENDLD